MKSYYFISYEKRNNNGHWVKQNRLIDKHPFEWLYKSMLSNTHHLISYYPVTESEYTQYKRKLDSVINTH